MGRAYKKDLADLHQTYQRVANIDVGEAARLWESVIEKDLICIGSGGAYSAASYVADVHQHVTRSLGVALTPLEVLADGLSLAGRACVFISAKGRNPDILASFRAAAASESSALIAVCGRSASPLSELASDTSSAAVLPLEFGRLAEGYLATNSLLAFCLALLRVYRELTRCSDLPPTSLSTLLDLISIDGRPWSFSANAHYTGLARRSILVLYDPAFKSAAVDLESRCIEGALADVHITDIRNFAHGRHFWLARHEGDTGVLILARPQTSTLATKTAELLPSSVPIHRVDIEGDRALSSLAGLMAVVHIAGWIADHHQLDPGRPHVPEFGRRLYHLKPKINQVQQSDIRARATARKFSVRSALRTDDSEYELVRTAAELFLSKMSKSKFRAIVADHDGTIVETNSRFSGISEYLRDAFFHAVGAAEVFALVSGRGRSLLANLRAVVPDALSEKLIVGLYNGAVVGTLSDISIPDSKHAGLESIARELTRKLQDTKTLSIVVKPFQLSITSPTLTRLQFAYETASAVVETWSDTNYSVVRSAHSVDVYPRGQGKGLIVSELQRRTPDLKESEILFIGDAGRWPGNDFALLARPFGLSVDSVSTDLNTCWNLSPLGLRNSRAFLYYLQQLRFEPDGHFVFHVRE